MLMGIGDFVSKFLVNLVLQQIVHDLSIHSDSLGIQLHIKYFYILDMDISAP